MTLSGKSAEQLRAELARTVAKRRQLQLQAHGYAAMGCDEIADPMYEEVNRLGKRIVQLNSRLGYAERNEDGNRTLGD